MRLDQGFSARTLAQADPVSTEFPSLRECWRSSRRCSRSSVLGTLLGIVPGAGATIASFVSYGVETQYGERRELLAAACRRHRRAPGRLHRVGRRPHGAAAHAGHTRQRRDRRHPRRVPAARRAARAADLHRRCSALVYAIFASLFVGVIGMCLMGYFWIRLLIKVLYLPQAVISAFVVLFCFVGAYAERNNVTDLWMIVVSASSATCSRSCASRSRRWCSAAILGPCARTRS